MSRCERAEGRVGWAQALVCSIYAKGHRLGNHNKTTSFFFFFLFFFLWQSSRRVRYSAELFFFFSYSFHGTFDLEPLFSCHWLFGVFFSSAAPFLCSFHEGASLMAAPRHSAGVPSATASYSPPNPYFLHSNSRSMPSLDYLSPAEDCFMFRCDLRRRANEPFLRSTIRLKLCLIKQRLLWSWEWTFSVFGVHDRGLVRGSALTFLFNSVFYVFQTHHKKNGIQLEYRRDKSSLCPNSYSLRIIKGPIFLIK